MLFCIDHNFSFFPMIAAKDMNGKRHKRALKHNRFKALFLCRRWDLNPHDIAANGF